MGVHLLTGSDESILRAKAHDLVHQLVGDGDRSLMVDEFDDDEYELREVADAAQTMPFLTDRRVVVARDVGRFSADELTPLYVYLENPLDSTELVLVGLGGHNQKKVTDAVKAAGGHLIKTTPPSAARDRTTWVRVEAEEHGLRLDAAAADRIAKQLGEDAGRLEGLMGILRSTYGDGVRIGVAEVEPFLGEGGGVPPWDLTDAIDNGKTALALTLMGRMMHGGGRHPLVIMSTLHRHYSSIARLDGADARNKDEAAAAIGVKPTFQAEKALRNYRRMGGDGAKRAIELVARADLALRGETDLDNELVMEVLVARLSRLGRG